MCIFQAMTDCISIIIIIIIIVEVPNIIKFFFIIPVTAKNLIVKHFNFQKFRARERSLESPGQKKKKKNVGSNYH